MIRFYFALGEDENPTFSWVARASSIFLSVLVGSNFAVILRTKSEESPYIATLATLRVTNKVGSLEIQTGRKGTFLALFYSFLHYYCTLLHIIAHKKLLSG